MNYRLGRFQPLIRRLSHSTALIARQRGNLVFGLLLGLSVGLLQYGGAAVIKHYQLRLLLPLCTPAPRDLVRWLEEACTRSLLVRVGGGYRFYHELLQRHFAEDQAER